MREFVFLIIGLLLGEGIGVALMCFLQINRTNESDTAKEKDKRARRADLEDGARSSAAQPDETDSNDPKQK